MRKDCEKASQKTCLSNIALPFGHRSPKGRLRWYLIQVPEGQESSSCKKLRRLIPEDLLEDIFYLQKERWMKRDGLWFTKKILMYRGFLIAASRDVISLNKSLSKLSFPAKLLGSKEHAFVPLSDEVRLWFSKAMDKDHVVRASTARIEDGILHVLEGPLVGQEARVSKIDRHKRLCFVRLSEQSDTFLERFALDVAYKS